ncbi:MAG: PHP domain-containing protein [Acidobacteria bacterium]|nr:PHP domain-containing protein [Acidobacteriota bacterium]
MKADLHIHTQASDGTWTPAHLVEHVRAAGIGLFAAIDHDSTDSVTACEELALKTGLRFLRGAEISTTFKGNLYHMLAYGIDPANEGLRLLLAANQKLHDATDLECLRLLQRDSFPVDIQSFEAYENNPARGGWKGLNYLIDRGICTGVEDCLSRLFGDHRPMPFPTFPEPADIIRVVADAGGVPVLAHPGARWISITDGILEDFLHAGLRGLECYTSYHDPATSRRFVEWCNRHDMLITGGSDCHGDFVPERKLGVPSISLSDLRLGELRRAIVNGSGSK